MVAYKGDVGGGGGVGAIVVMKAPPAAAAVSWPWPVGGRGICCIVDTEFTTGFDRIGIPVDVEVGPGDVMMFFIFAFCRAKSASSLA